eukprot:3141787-Rhodomonas_salina.1
MKAWEEKRAEWGPLSKSTLEKHAEPGVDSMEPEQYELHFKSVLPKVIAAGVNLVGRTSLGSNQPAYWTKEVTGLVKTGRMLTAAKRETHVMKSGSVRYTHAQQRAWKELDIDPPSLPISTPDLELLRDKLQSAYKETMEELKKVTSKMEQENINESLELARKELGKKRFSVQKALGKINATGTLD